MARHIMLAALALIATSAVAAASPPGERVYTRAGAVHLHPLEQSDEVELFDVKGAARLAVSNGPIAGSRVEIEPLTIPAVIVGFVLPWWQGRAAIEAVLAAPLNLTIRSGGTLAEKSLAPTALGLPTGVPALGAELGTTKAVPPIVTMVYRFGRDRWLTPYLGGGLSVFFAYDSKITNPVMREVAEPELHIDPAWGVVAQAGITGTLHGRFHAVLDVKFIGLMRVSATVREIHVRTPELPLFDKVRVGNARVDVAANPLIIFGGVGASF